MSASSSEKLLGLIWSNNLGRDDWGGYALAVSQSRIAGARRHSMFHHLEVYLGPGPGSKRTSDKHRQRAQEIFAEILPSKDFELTKEAITRIAWKPEGFTHGGSYVFSSNQGDIQINTKATSGNLSVVHTVNGINATLVDFLPERFYNVDFVGKRPDLRTSKDRQEIQEVLVDPS